MKVKMTLYEVYEKLRDLREQKAVYSRLVGECYMEDDKSDAKHFAEKFKHINEVIDYYSAIEVEFENKYVTEDQ